ncbi:TonB-dependent copper receptor [Comamonas aquatica]|jgi:iron complex outermembrane receptor protein|uniref:Vitamin B12/cobalamin outer membrane transporter n=1 Tax=Comamonas aquatica TaxID=225991 RepID=A0AA35D500_9BURK|nr:TonB-dependent copper receptor [Comamonas aquatica]CAB5653028.1 vitamin B12/cobalamin outer membrane transporter [Comamonas aquatica]CAB5667402.1 vitamin B12/cobalamin outer membrane transporter [Comamonas aquatica]CAC9206364.1 vitamin B12/cobalamin outer membrane transporter [Comamonas aquatica]CAC9687494.1 vitamin B12/cobalamin outer membrane transporter [Comamonas aquatica]
MHISTKTAGSAAANRRPSALSQAQAARTAVALAVLSLVGWQSSAWAQTPEAALQEVVVTAVHDHAPVQVVADPKQPRQPVPASDAADYLKSIPGFSAIRSGGSNSDPVFRGQFGSRLPLLTNGTTLLGACPGRMDAPSSYISPETYDALTVIKGPQTVAWGPGASAGVVRFDREKPQLGEPGIEFSASLLAGTAARSDQNVDFLAGNDQFYVRLTANHSQSKDYRDGSGRVVPAHWDKWNADVALGWTPDADTWLELTAGAGDGEARYGGRGMDGTQFQRESAGLRFEKTNLSPVLRKLEAQIYTNRADHVMDNFSLRSFAPGGGMAMPMASNVRRTTTGLRTAATWQWSPATTLLTGVDALRSPHDKRMGSQMVPYTTKPWVRDAKFSNLGLFAELTQQLDADDKLLTGLRLDRAQAWRYPGVQGDSNHRERQALPSGFVRWERASLDGTTVYAGLGHVQRFPDYWELISPGNSTTAFQRLQPEKTTQIDVGASWKRQDWQAWTSAYVGQVQDYILFDYQGGMSSSVRNVQARIAGWEAGASYRLNAALTAQGTLAYAWAQNTTDDRPLPQTPPLEAKLGLDYQQGAWNAGALWRLVAAQHRHATGQGNVVGKDFGPSAGFGVFSVHAGYKVDRRLKLTAGIDNLFDRAYAEHLNLAGNAGFGLPAGVRIHEPGRTLWLRADLRY